MRAHAVGESEALAYLATALTAPLERRVGAADIRFIGLQRLMALWTFACPYHGLTLSLKIIAHSSECAFPADNCG
jgi:hypothetical protein